MRGVPARASRIASESAGVGMYRTGSHRCEALTPKSKSNFPPALAAATTPAVAAPATIEAPMATVREPELIAGRTVFSPRNPKIRIVSPAMGPSKYSAPCPSKTPPILILRPITVAVTSPVVVKLM